MALNVGDKIPEMLGVNQDGVEVKASDYTGRKLVLYFYPKDNTPGCTAEACSLRDNFSDLRKAGYEILGASLDDEKSHKKFIEKQQLPFPLIADTDKRLIEEFGVWGEKKFMGKDYMGILRTTFLINEQGIIEKIIGPKEIKTKDHGQQILNQ
ncbi:thioredoxin-dependent thiol peroxidase [Dysgonomonas sp. ZJ279]|uniref:thioredoxin-dependent thiol peroxidase n=1 Tax=Dysgonomonas sp. ZJ279 TaxID=2709796 RepID=UPI0013EB1B0F|nr:thioredoxin-dependent thiol peroxidase [Dysgonomonas sp. ZJ279]